MQTWFSRKKGTGKPNIICPMEKYMRTSRTTIELFSLRIIFGVSVSFRASSCSRSFSDAGRAFLFSPIFTAPYPARSTARMISSPDALPSTVIELVRRLTLHCVTPGTPRTAFSTWAWHAAQLIPVTLYFSILPLPVCQFQETLIGSVFPPDLPAVPYFISFWVSFTSSSIVSVFPLRISSFTQVLIWDSSSSLLKLFSALFTADTCIRISGQ